jgi:3-hydroxyisobutyrate dehydrogenase-like beta-hydroxyacid dehydrogenase
MARIGFIGLGNMGRGMAANLVRKGETVVVHDVVEAPVRALKELGASAGATAAEVAGACDIIFTMLPTTAAVAEVIGGADGLLSHAKKGTIVVDMSTIDPLVTDRLAADAAARCSWSVRLTKPSPRSGRSSKRWGRRSITAAALGRGCGPSWSTTTWRSFRVN